MEFPECPECHGGEISPWRFAGDIGSRRQGYRSSPLSPPEEALPPVRRFQRERQKEPSRSLPGGGPIIGERAARVCCARESAAASAAGEGIASAVQRDPRYGRDKSKGFL